MWDGLLCGRLRQFGWQSSLLLVLLLLAGLSGCQWTRSLLCGSRESPGFQTVRIDYRFDRPIDWLNRTFDVESDSLPPTATDLDVAAAAPEPGNTSKGVLSIQYPHPTGDRTQAEVALTLVHDTSHSRRRNSETRVMNIARSQLELLIGDLATDGFFDRKSRDDGETELKVEIDRNRTQRSWRFEPRLLDLAHRVISNGEPEAQR